MEVSWDSYGKGKVRLGRVIRHGDVHNFLEALFNIQLEGAFQTAFTHGSNESVLPTDTMKNTVYCIAKKHETAQIEELSLALCNHFLSTQKHVSKVSIDVSQVLWDRAVVGGRPHNHAFLRGGSGEKRTCSVVMTREGQTTVHGGIQDLVVLKTTQSGFEGYIRDAYTTLQPTADRIFATNVKATWKFSTVRGVDFARVHAASRGAILEHFAGPADRGVYSPSVQFTMYRMGEALLAASPEVEEVTLCLPNLHYIPFNLGPMGMTNANEVFVATDEPHGDIRATVARRRPGAGPTFRPRM